MNLINSVTSGMNFNFGNDFFNNGFKIIMKMMKMKMKK